MNFKEINPKDDEEWHALRVRVLTATDMGVILGLNKWKSVRELIESKHNFIPFENAYTWLGQVLEPVVVESVNKVLGSNFKLFDDGSRSFFVDEEIGLGATPDAYSKDALLECKSTKPHNALRWAELPPPYYLMQLYVQMLCTGYRVGYLAILSTNLTQSTETLNLPLNIFKIERTEYLDNVILNEVKRFWKAQSEGKLFRVDRKQSTVVELKLYILLNKLRLEGGDRGSKGS